MGILDFDHFGCLRPENKKATLYDIVGFDTEDNTKGVPVAFVFHDGEKSFYTKDARKAVKYILEYPRPALFCAHNLEYDIGNLMKHCGFKWVDRMVYASRLLRVTLKFSKNSFVNSAAFFPGSVKSMGQVVGLPKLDGDPFSREYADRDAHIVQIFMSKLQKRLYEDYGANLGVSIGQLSMEIYRRMFLREKTQTWCPPEVLAGYYGGRVEMFYKGLALNGVTVADFNSCYPYVMRHRDYPDTNYIGRASLSDEEFGLGRFTVMVPKDLFVPPLPYRSPESHRLYFPTGMMTGWWTFAEVRKAEAMGCKVFREWEAYGTSRSVQPFNEFVDHFYGLRQGTKAILKANSEDPNALFDSAYYKLVLNNLYGKLAQHLPNNVMTRTPLPPAVLEKHPDVKMSKVEPFYSYTLARSKAPATANYLWGIYVTAYSRLHLLEHLTMVAETPGCQLIYCDTDSVMYSGECPAFKEGGKLGELSIERFDRGLFRQSKGYLLFNRVKCNCPFGRCIGHPGEYQVEKVACKGVPVGHALDFVVKGIATVQKPMRLKEALIQLHANKGLIDDPKVLRQIWSRTLKVTRKGKDGAFEREIGINVWDKVVKEMRSIYVKRKGAAGVTRPIDVGDIVEAESQSLAEAFSLEEELVDSDVRLKPKYKPSTAFLNVQIPPGWFDETPPEKGPYRELESVQRHLLRAAECEVLLPGECWFAGKVIGIEYGEKSMFYRVNLRFYLDLEVDTGSMEALLHPRYIHQEDVDEEFIGTTLDVTLKEQYLKGKPLRLSVQVQEPDPIAHGLAPSH